MSTWEETRKGDLWWVGPEKHSTEEDEELRQHQRKLIETKERLESIPLDSLSFTDLYEFPFTECHGYINDKNGNFIFQINISSDSITSKILSILNSESTPTKKNKFVYYNGSVSLEREDGTLQKDIITIRGWGNLTGTGSYNLSGKVASKIQDTLGEFIAKKLTWFDWKPIK
jgi:hypothetical protein